MMRRPDSCHKKPRERAVWSMPARFPWARGGQCTALWRVVDRRAAGPRAVATATLRQRRDDGRLQAVLPAGPYRDGHAGDETAGHVPGPIPSALARTVWT